MPLNPSILETEFRTFMDKEFVGFRRFPGSKVEFSEYFSSAILKYTQTMIPPSTTLFSAKFSMMPILLGVSPMTPLSMVLPLAMTTYVSTLIPGMLPGFVGIIPPSPIVIQPVLSLGMAGGKTSEVVRLLVSIVDSWFRTGTYFTVTPTGPVFSGNWL